jgi:hypothetical protein
MFSIITSNEPVEKPVLGYFAFERFRPIANFLLSKRSFLHSIMTIASIWCLLQAHIAPFGPSLYGIAKHSP